MSLIARRILRESILKNISRRFFAAGAASLVASLASANQSTYGTRELQPRTHDNGLIPRFSFEVISLDVRGDLGVSVLDTETGRSSGWDENSLYPLNSTFKFLLAGAVLQRVDRRQHHLEHRLEIHASDIVSWSPVVQHSIGGTMSVRELCEAAMTRSDNAAANILLRNLGGPEALTAILRDMGDPITRIDRFETELNDVSPGEVRDSSTPLQMLKSMNSLLLGDVLSANGKDQLVAWMIANTTGAARIRAGVPMGWSVGDRTGTGSSGETSTIAAIYPPDRKPLLMSVYIRGPSDRAEAQDSTHAELARIATTNVLLPPLKPYPDE
ncbi:class A beta-lactamase [Epibacterium sp. Ofav1-8]|uniref:class A beta-lactamase n=1 Tax=Epibacterium sp. Ofav1-8 TaxID=2917735 RepID=UPI001EF47822|nr:class A beta-lactamase [Epibacterium sp. Ofav1-8]